LGLTAPLFPCRTAEKRSPATNPVLAAGLEQEKASKPKPAAIYQHPVKELFERYY